MKKFFYQKINLSKIFPLIDKSVMSLNIKEILERSSERKSPVNSPKIPRGMFGSKILIPSDRSVKNTESVRPMFIKKTLIDDLISSGKIKIVPPEGVCEVIEEPL